MVIERRSHGGAGTVVDDDPWSGIGDGPVGAEDWRADVALELWVDQEGVRPRIRVAGRLDDDTAGNLLQVVAELLDGGAATIEVWADDQACMDGPAARVLGDAGRLARTHGGSLVQVGPVPCPALSVPG
jgi:hypothetical protein